MNNNIIAIDVIVKAAATVAKKHAISNTEFDAVEVMEEACLNPKIIPILISDPEKYSALAAKIMVTLVDTGSLNLRKTKKGKNKFSLGENVKVSNIDKKIEELPSQDGIKIFRANNQAEVDAIMEMAAKNPNLKLKKVLQVNNKTGEQKDITSKAVKEQSKFTGTISKTSSATSTSSTSGVKKASKTAIVKELKDNPGKFCSVTYVKNDGTTGATAGRLFKGEEMNEQGYLVFHTKEGGIRNVNPRTITGAKVNGVIYLATK